MRLRALAVLMLAVTLGVKIVPCEASSVPEPHDCCNPEGCPDLINAAPGSHHQSPSSQHADDCCAMGAQRHQHQQNRMPSAPVPLPFPVLVTSALLMAPSNAAAHPPPESPPPRARSAGLHVLYSVFLI